MVGDITLRGRRRHANTNTARGPEARTLPVLNSSRAVSFHGLTPPHKVEASPNQGTPPPAGGSNGGADRRPDPDRRHARDHTGEIRNLYLTP